MIWFYIRHVKRSIPNWLKNKYIITGLAFVIWMTFINDIDLIYIFNSRAELRDVKAEVERLKLANQEAKESLLDLSTNQESLEKFARETYYMKRPNEDLFIIKEVALEEE